MPELSEGIVAAIEIRPVPDSVKEGEAMNTSYDPGFYEVEVVDAILTAASNDTPQLCLCIAVRDQYMDAENLLPCSGPDQKIFYAITEATMGTPDSPGWVWQVLQDLGFEGPSLRDLAPIIGKKRKAQLQYEIYKGTDRPRWTLFRLNGQTGKPPLAADVIDALDAKFAGLLTPQQAATPRTRGRKKAEAGF